MFGFLNNRVAKRGGLRNLTPIGLFAGLCLPLAAVNSARGVIITSGTYTGLSASPSSDGIGEPGDDGYAFNQLSAVSGGDFTGGDGGGTSGGSDFNIAGAGGNGADAYTPTGSVTISGGTFMGGNGGDATGTASFGGDGGNALEAYDHGVVTVSGGAFTPGTPGTGGDDDGGPGYDFYAYTDGVITLVGTFENAPASPITNASGTITGTLADNSAVGTYSYDVPGNGELILVAPVPEPIALSSITLAGSVLLLKRRRLA